MGYTVGQGEGMDMYREHVAGSEFGSFMLDQIDQVKMMLANEYVPVKIYFGGDATGVDERAPAIYIDNRLCEIRRDTAVAERTYLVLAMFTQTENLYRAVVGGDPKADFARNQSQKREEETARRRGWTRGPGMTSNDFVAYAPDTWGNTQPQNYYHSSQSYESPPPRGYTYPTQERNNSYRH